MKRSVRSLDPASLAGQRVLVRVDYNVPIEQGVVEDATRIEASVPTLRYLLDAGAHPIVISHLGRPKGQVVPDLSLQPVAPVLSAALNAPVRFVPDLGGEETHRALAEIADGQVLLLENTRFDPGEEANDAALGKRLAELAEVYVSDAFGSVHRAHASTVGAAVASSVAVAGLLVERELEVLERLRHSVRQPFVVVFGGAKIADKIELIDALLGRADALLIGGAMANTFLRARGLPTGTSLVEDEAVDVAAQLLVRPGNKLHLPDDLVITEDLASDGAAVRVVPADGIPDGWSAVDIGPETREMFSETVRSALTLFWNGPMGLFEDPRFADGTYAVARAAAISTSEGGFTVIGGGDSARAIREAGLSDAVTHVSTGGGASLEYLATGTLPGIEALDSPEGVGSGAGVDDGRQDA